MAFLPVIVCVLSLSIPHGMHLVVPTHPYFFWVACHPSRTFPPKEPEQKPQNRLFSFPHCQIMPFLLSDPWLTTSYIGWVQASGAWILHVLLLLRMLLIHLPWSRDWSVHSTVHFCLLIAWAVFWSAILYNLLLLGVGPCWIVGLPSPGLLYIHSVALLAFLVIPLCYSCYNVVWLHPVRPLWAYYLFPSQWLSVFTGPFLTLFAGSCVPFPSWASLAYLFSFNFLGPFSILLSHGPILTLLGFSNPITLYLILGTDGSSISPLLSLLALLWAYCDPFTLFYILPIGLLLSFWTHSSPFSSSGSTLWAREPFILATWAQWLFLAC